MRYLVIGKFFIKKTFLTPPKMAKSSPWEVQESQKNQRFHNHFGVPVPTKPAHYWRPGLTYLTLSHTLIEKVSLRCKVDMRHILKDGDLPKRGSKNDN